MFCCYNPNFSSAPEFLVQFESYLHGIDLSKQQYIVGDLNIDFCSNNANIIQPLMNNYDLNNCVKDPTRVAFKKIQQLT